MFHPVGSQPPSVYWRRRLIVLGSTAIVIILLVVTISALTSSGSTSPNGMGTTTPPSVSTSSTSTSPAASTSSTSDGSSASSAPASAASPTGSSTAAPVTCRSADLDVIAVVGQDTYKVGDKPVVELQVTNEGTSPCVQDLADKQILLKVYNGESRVWGSHDCETMPGTNERTLAVGAPVRVSVNWSGYTSRPNCAGKRQHVGAGTYTLYASLSGKTGKVAQFTIT